MQWRFLTARRVDIAGKSYLVGTGLDVTERKKLERELEHQARTDFLTGIPNRRHFLDLADLELARARRYGRPFSMLMLDLDLFKNVNDRYGHRVGDLTLQKVVEVCGQILREVDVVGRLGGEEFGIILPETDAEQALQVADRVRQAVATASVALPKGGSVGITTSIGVATYSDADPDVDAVLNRADRALYRAKRSGRDRVSSEGESSVA
jgi:diguanylate cyclase (GGDEF)-like protein